MKRKHEHVTKVHYLLVTTEAIEFSVANTQSTGRLVRNYCISSFLCRGTILAIIAKQVSMGCKCESLNVNL